MDKKARKALRKSIRNGSYKKMDPISIRKRKKEIMKKKFNAYLNPGTDEAEFRSNTKRRYEENDKAGYEKGRDKVKRILDNDDDKK